MKGIVASAVILMASISHAAPPCGAHGTRETMLVSAAWLAAHLADPNVVVLAVGRPGEYERAATSPARWISNMPISPSGAGERPSPLSYPRWSAWPRSSRQVGVSNSSRVILYVSNDSLSLTTRAYLTLDAMGMGARTSLMEAW